MSAAIQSFFQISQCQITMLQTSVLGNFATIWRKKDAIKDNIEADNVWNLDNIKTVSVF